MQLRVCTINAHANLWSIGSKVHFCILKKWYLPVRSFVNFWLAEVGVLKLSPEKLLTRLNEAPGREAAVTGQSINSSLVVGEL